VFVYLVGAEEVFGDFMGVTALEASIPEGGETELRVQLPAGLDDLRHSGGLWKPLVLNAEVLPVEQHAARTPDAN
jgi:hypothetical protein